MATRDAQVTADEPHVFGGAWTELKLDAVSYYLRFYTKVLKEKPTASSPFELWYVDAFAGSGWRRVEREVGGIFEERPGQTEQLDMAGSVLRALDIDPPFKRLVFIEGHRGRFRQLEAIKTQHPERNIVPVKGEANECLRGLFSKPPWSEQRQGRGSYRAVVFLDPYGMSVEWSTLELLAATGAVDVWYLFPTAATNRQLAGELGRVDEHKQRSLDEIFGITTWREDIYATTVERNLFEETITSTSKTFTVDQIEGYAKRRLENLFAYVSDPLPLFNDQSSKLFSLFCLSNSTSPKALGLIKNGVASVLRKFACH